MARVVEIGEHDHAEGRAGRRVRLHPGDRIVGALGNRYATDVYEGYVLDQRGVHLLTAGGLIGSVVSAHDVRRRPTRLEICGGVCDAGGRPLSTEDFGLPAPPAAARRPPTVVVVGSGMSAGKTTTAAAMVLSWTRAGLRAGAGKVTGSGSGKDRWGGSGMLSRSPLAAREAREATGLPVLSARELAAGRALDLLGAGIGAA